MVNDRLHALHEDWRFAKDIGALDSSWQMLTTNRLIDVGETELGLEIQRQRTGAQDGSKYRARRR